MSSSALRVVWHDAEDDEKQEERRRSLSPPDSSRIAVVLSEITSLTDSMASESKKILQCFLLDNNIERPSPPQTEQQESSSPSLNAAYTVIPPADDDSSMMLSHLAVHSASVFRSIASKDNRLETRQELQTAANDILIGKNINNNNNNLQLQQASTAFSLALIMAALALSTPLNARVLNRSAASAIASTLQKETNSENSSLWKRNSNSLLFEELVHALLVTEASTTSSTTNADNSIRTTSTSSSTDLHILTALARALNVTSCSSNELAEEALGEIVGTSTQARASSPSIALIDDVEKADTAAALACAAQLGHPWRVLQPNLLIDRAVSLSLWHAAERLCQAVVDTTTSKIDKNDDANYCSNNGDAVAVAAACCLVDAALETRTYRLADAYATRFFATAGPARYLDARYLHACDTIGRIIRKRALPIIERQADRVDKAVAKVVTASAACSAEGNDATREAFTSVETASADIRNFAICQLEESGDVDTAQRLAEVWGMDYTHDEEKLRALLAAKREKFLQWDDLFPDVPIPNAIATPDLLLKAFHEFFCNNSPHERVFGFDVEWADKNTGAALLQISTSMTAILIDVLELSKTAEGANALEATVGRLFASTGSSTVVGFACRQDLAQLRATQCPSRNNQQQEHWLTTTTAVVDLKHYVAAPFNKLGLSRCCEYYLGKPLDKSEQCSSWTRRPLSVEQRVYAALDAHVCALIYLQTQQHNNNKINDDRALPQHSVAKKARNSSAL